MQLEIDGSTVNVNPAEQSDEWLLDATQEIADAARERGLELPYVTGIVAVESAIKSPETTVEAPTPAIKESLIEQLPFTIEGYRNLIDSINENRSSKDKLEASTQETFAAELEAWLTVDKLAHVIATKEAQPDVEFTLVAVPNVAVNPEDIYKATSTFGQGQDNDKDLPPSIQVLDELYDNYTAEQLSGTDPENGNALQFSLIPSSNTPGMKGSVAEQRFKLAKMQMTYPGVGLKVPSVLESISHWQTLRAQGDNLNDKMAPLHKTGVNHFNLPEKNLYDMDYLPKSYVGWLGSVHLQAYIMGESEQSARISVG